MVHEERSVRILDQLNECNFGLDGAGRRVFYLWGPLAPGWVVPSRTLELRIRRRLLGWAIGSCLALMLAVGMLLTVAEAGQGGPRLPVLLVSVPLACIGAMVVHISMLLAPLERSQQPQSAEAFANQLVASVPRSMLWAVVPMSLALLGLFGWAAVGSHSPLVRDAAGLGLLLVAPGPFLAGAALWTSRSSASHGAP